MFSWISSQLGSTVSRLKAQLNCWRYGWSSLHYIMWFLYQHHYAKECLFFIYLKNIDQLNLLIVWMCYWFKNWHLQDVFLVIKFVFNNVFNKDFLNYDETSKFRLNYIKNLRNLLRDSVDVCSRDDKLINTFLPT